MGKKRDRRDHDLQINLSDTEGNKLRGEIPYKGSLLQLLKRAGLVGCYSLAKVSEKPLEGTLDFVGRHDVRVASKAAKPTSGIIALLGGNAYYIYMLVVPPPLEFQFVYTRLYDAALNPNKHFRKITLGSTGRGIKDSVDRPVVTSEILSPLAPTPLTEEDKQLLDDVLCFTRDLYPQVKAGEVVLAELQRMRDSWQLTATVSQSGHSVSVGDRSSIAGDVVAYLGDLIRQTEKFLSSNKAQFAVEIVTLEKTYPRILSIAPQGTQY